MTNLVKWYCDLTTEDGSAIIGYWARFRWGLLSLSYASFLLSRPGQGVKTQEKYWNTAEPVADGEDIGWSCPPLGLQGRWRRKSPGVHLRLLETPSGTVDWHCPMPQADATIVLGRKTFTGLGYVERLSMNIAPWQLPFAELRWGRALTPQQHVVWIDWVGGHARRWVMLNGQLVAAPCCNDTEIVITNGPSIALSEKRTLRERRLGEVWPGLGRCLPRRVREAQESKWLSRATWSDGILSSAIHEVVRWA